MTSTEECHSIINAAMEKADTLDWDTANPMEEEVADAFWNWLENAWDTVRYEPWTDEEAYADPDAFLQQALECATEEIADRRNQ